ncbi:MAG TPA: 30S ribosomal protein S2, partial [Gaiellaceae bacterium]|nr:30S ribosomal protein S2 [Gaiellaceae bacterium]
VVALVDTNCDPDDADFVIPGNDDAIRSCNLVLRVIADGIAAGQGKLTLPEMTAPHVEPEAAAPEPEPEEAVPAAAPEPEEEAVAGEEPHVEPVAEQVGAKEQ